MEKELRILEAYRNVVMSNPLPNASEVRELKRREAEFNRTFKVSTSEKSLAKFNRVGIVPQEDYIDDDGNTWVMEYDNASPSGYSWQALK